MMKQTNRNSNSTAYSNFVNAISNEKTLMMYIGHMRSFLDRIEFETDTKDLEDRLNHLYDGVILHQHKADGLKWFNDAIADFMLFKETDSIKNRLLHLPFTII